MKKFLLASVALVSLASCSNDDDNVNEASIVGTWHESKSVLISGKDKSVISTTVSDDCEKKSTFEFTTANKLNVNAYEFYSNACQKLDPETLSYSYTSSTGKTIISYPDQIETDTYDTKVSTNELQLSQSINDENNDGVADIEVLYFTR